MEERENAWTSGEVKKTSVTGYMQNWAKYENKMKYVAEWDALKKDSWKKRE